MNRVKIGIELTPAQRQLQSLVKDCLLQQSVNDPAVSLRSFARDIGVSAPSLSGFFRGNRVPSRTLAEKMMAALAIEKDIARSILENWENAYFHTLDQKNAESLASSVYFFAVLELIEILGGVKNLSDLSKRLHIPLNQVERITNILIKYEMVSKNENGEFIATGDRYSICPERPAPNLRKLFMDSLEVTKTVISRLDDESRWRKSETGHMIVGVDPSRIGEAKERLKKFRRDFALSLENGERRDVYLLAINFIPLSIESEIPSNVPEIPPGK